MRPSGALSDPPLRAEPPDSDRRIAHAFPRDGTPFVCAVLIGTVAGVLMRPLLLSWVGDAIASHAALAVATTLTGATHVRLVHGKSFRALVPQTLVSAPLAHAAMRAAHSLLGS